MALSLFMTSLENGVFTVDYWDLRNGATGYGDEGVLSGEGCVGSTCEPPMSTPFPSYYAISMLSKLGLPGPSELVPGQPALCRLHAVQRGADRLRLRR
jgi:hypothetical protein